MPQHKQFEDLVVWQKAKTLVIDTYRTFAGVKDFGFRDQMQRAALSVMNNIAEGFERQSDKEFAKFLYIAKGSCGEVRSMLYIATELGNLSEPEQKKLLAQSTEISKMLAGFITTLKTH